MQHAISAPAKPSALMLSDRLITLAQDADRAGHVAIADRLVQLAHTIFDEQRPRAVRQRCFG